MDNPIAMPTHTITITCGLDHNGHEIIATSFTNTDGDRIPLVLALGMIEFAKMTVIEDWQNADE